MNARQELAGIMEQWLQLTQAEGAAIQKSQWPALQRIQSLKSALRASLAGAVRQCAAEDKISGANQPAPRLIRARAAKIMSLLNRNAEEMAAQLRRARAQQEKLNEARRNLRKIQGSYAGFPPRRAWQSYS